MAAALRRRAVELTVDRSLAATLAAVADLERTGPAYRMTGRGR